MRIAAWAALGALVMTSVGAVSATAQQALTGTVVDETGRPVPRAEILLLPGEATARTDDAGRFAFPEMYPRQYVINVRSIGYRMYEDVIRIESDAPLRLDIVLPTSAPTLDTLRAQISQQNCSNNSFAGFKCRQQAGVAFFRDSATLVALRPRQAFDLARGLPGIRQTMGRGPDGQREFVPAVKPSRCLLTMVNGRLDPNPRRWEPQDVIGLEYYDTWRKLPLSYRQIVYQNQQGTENCDVIIYWLQNAPRR